MRYRPHNWREAQYSGRSNGPALFVRKLAAFLVGLRQRAGIHPRLIQKVADAR